jgi:uncharacterized membrane protein
MVSAHPKLRVIWGSFVAVLIGWLAAVALLEIERIVNFVYHRDQLSWNVLWVTPLWFSMWILAFALPVWLVALVPLSLFVPRSSVLWHWPICTVCGALAGALVVAVVFPLPGRGIAPKIWFPYTLGATIGAITCLVASLTRHRFEQP